MPSILNTNANVRIYRCNPYCWKIAKFKSIIYFDGIILKKNDLPIINRLGKIFYAL